MDPPPVITLSVTYPEAYPDVGPHLDIASAPNSPKHPLFDVSEDKSQLLDALQPTIAESLGMAMVFTLVTTLKEMAETLIADRQRQVAALKEVEARKVEEEENRRFHGKMVTKERFLEWREKFRREMAEKERRQREEEEADEKKKRGGKLEEKRLTGRQLWERGLAGKGDEEDAEAEDATIAVGNLHIES